jgi:Uma2 family endonuclease
MVAQPSTLVSEAEFLALPASTQRTELLDGEVIVAPSPSTRHQLTCRRLTTALANWADGQTSPVFVGQSPLDVRFGPSRILQPDAFVILAEVDPDQEGPLHRVPDLCVEVVSENRVYDRITKRLIYAAAGVREYWTVEPYGVVERWTGDGLATMEEIRDRLATPLLPGFDVDLADLFA